MGRLAEAVESAEQGAAMMTSGFSKFEVIWCRGVLAEAY